MALLAAYMIWGDGQTLEDFLDDKVFKGSRTDTIMATGDEVSGFDKYIRKYKAVLEIERKALEVFDA